MPEPLTPSSESPKPRTCRGFFILTKQYIYVKNTKDFFDYQLESKMSEHLYFHSKKRFGVISYDEFMGLAQKLVTLCEKHTNKREVEIVTCEDPMTYEYAHAAYEASEAEAYLSNRKEYQLEDFTVEMWQRSLDVMMVIRTYHENNSLCIAFSCDRSAGSKRLEFYGQNMSRDLIQEVRRDLVPFLRYKTNDGFFRIWRRWKAQQKFHDAQKTV